MDQWLIIAIVTGVIALIGSMVAAVFAAMVGALFGAGTYFFNRLINGFDEKNEGLKQDIKEVEDQLNHKLTTNSTVHFNESKEAYANIKVLKRITKNL